jgi:hypothetical protein
MEDVVVATTGEVEGEVAVVQAVVGGLGVT